MKGFKNYFGEMLTAIIIIGLAIFSFVQIGTTNALDSHFWVSFSVNFGIMLLITSVWYPNAKQKAQWNDQNYILQRTEYAKLMNKIVETNNFKGLNEFCEYATEQNRVEKIKHILSGMNIDFDIYKKCNKDLSLIDKEPSLTEKQKKKLYSLITTGVKVEKINPSSISTGINKLKKHYDTKSTEPKYDRFKISAKMIISATCSIFTAILVFSAGGFTWESVAQLSMWLILIIWNCFTSYQAGYKSISLHRAEYYKKLRTFLEEFIGSSYFKKEGGQVDEKSSVNQPA